MKKIPTIFERDWSGNRSLVLDKPNPDCAWVFAGDGIATRKLDGTSCMVRGGKLYRRREIRRSQTVPPDFEIVDRDEVLERMIGWIPVGDGPEDKWHREAFSITVADGTHELVGPNVQGNPEHYDRHRLVPHSSLAIWEWNPPARTFDGLKAWLLDKDIEGLVFHHPDGRMGKIKKRDFGLKR